MIEDRLDKAQFAGWLELEPNNNNNNTTTRIILVRALLRQLVHVDVKSLIEDHWRNDILALFSVALRLWANLMSTPDVALDAQKLHKLHMLLSRALATLESA